MTPISGSPPTIPKDPTKYDKFQQLWISRTQDPVELMMLLDLSLSEVNAFIERVKGCAWGDH